MTCAGQCSLHFLLVAWLVPSVWWTSGRPQKKLTKIVNNNQEEERAYKRTKKRIETAIRIFFLLAMLMKHIKIAVLPFFLVLWCLWLVVLCPYSVDTCAICHHSSWQAVTTWSCITEPYFVFVSFRLAAKHLWVFFCNLTWMAFVELRFG